MSEPAFVLHDHRKPRPHFDLRLEQDGVLRSWAVPRGLPESSSQNRLAVAVSDHDLDHLTYTDADKSIADIGWWEEESRTDKRIVFVLHELEGLAPGEIAKIVGSPVLTVRTRLFYARRDLLSLLAEEPSLAGLAAELGEEAPVPTDAGPAKEPA